MEKEKEGTGVMCVLVCCGEVSEECLVLADEVTQRNENVIPDSVTLLRGDRERTKELSDIFIGICRN